MYLFESGEKKKKKGGGKKGKEYKYKNTLQYAEFKTSI